MTVITNTLSETTGNLKTFQLNLRNAYLRTKCYKELNHFLLIMILVLNFQNKYPVWHHDQILKNILNISFLILLIES